MRREQLEGREAVIAAWPGTGPSEPRRHRARVPARVRRRRFLVALCSVVVAVAGLHGGTGEGSALASREGAPRAVLLERGDSLWDLAERFAPEGADARAYVDALVELNDVAGAPLPGTRIRLPR